VYVKPAGGDCQRAVAKNKDTVLIAADVVLVCFKLQATGLLSHGHVNIGAQHKDLETMKHKQKYQRAMECLTNIQKINI